MVASRIVRSVADASRWAEWQLGRLDSVHGTPGSKCSAVLANVFSGNASMSTTFSGIDAPGQALHGVCCSLQNQFGYEESLHVPCLAACEWNEESRMELNLHPCKPECLFVDVCEFIDNRIRKRVLDGAALGRFSYDSIKAVLLKPGAVTCTATCEQHGRGRCRFRRAQVHIAGTPCTDHSGHVGAKREGSTGSTMVPYFTWCAMRLAIEDCSFFFFVATI